MKKETALKVTYLNGPTAIIEISGLRFITDPTFDPSGTVYSIGKDLSVSKTANPVEVELGEIDFVLLSHDQHHDNFDTLGREFSKNVKRVFTTVDGAGRIGENVTGIQTWTSVTVNAPNGDKIEITGTPARHGPAGIEKISGQVTGFILSVKGSREFEIYITGDTVYYDGIAEVAKKLDQATCLYLPGEPSQEARSM